MKIKTDRVIAGLVVLAVGLWAIAAWWWFVVDILKGLVALGLVLTGLLLVGLGVKDNMGKYLGAESQEETE